MMQRAFAAVAMVMCFGSGIGLPAAGAADPVELGGIRFQVAAGWTLQQVAAEPLVRYPVHADLAPDGRLYIVESSGSSAPVKQQLEERPHRLVVLEDLNNDGAFDHRTVFAEGLMLPQGVLWTPQGILVGTPPEIWLLRDTNDDGIADERSVWFDGQTLTGCANDLHGPFTGRDGWIYWAKGAFAEQTYAQEDGSTWSTRASHIFRRHPRTGLVESVMTGGMDNPVEVAFSLCGERFFTCTFIQQPAEGRRDALVHAIYGGVYGKDHGVLDGHPRTGPLMPVMTHLGPAAPAGLMLREAMLSNENLRGDLFVAHFNLQKVSQHQLVDDGAGLRTEDSDLLVADRPDFHPTDVLEDADGSLLVVDTGGWYTLCCPTSHIDQSQATGGIYRLIPPSPVTAADLRGREIQWDSLESAALIELLGDPRPVVRRLARLRLVEQPRAAAALVNALQHRDTQQSTATSGGETALLRAHATWALIELIGRLDPVETSQRNRLLAALARSLDDPQPVVRLAAMQGLATYRFAPAADRLLQMLQSGEPRERRYAAEALGRLGDSRAVDALLAQLPTATGDRVLEHALLYALIELGPAAVPALTAALAAEQPASRLAALRVLGQRDDESLRAEHVVAILRSGTAAERELAIEMLARRPAWDSVVAESLPELLDQGSASEEPQRWQRTLQRLVLRPGLVEAVAGVISSGPEEQRLQLLAALAASPPAALPEAWVQPIAGRLAISAADDAELRQWASVLAAVRWPAAAPQPLVDACRGALARHESDVEMWLMLAAAAPPGASWQAATTEQAGLAPSFQRLVEMLGPDSPPHHRQLALAALARQPIAKAEAVHLATAAAELGPMELSGVLNLLRRNHDSQVNAQLFQALQASEQAAGLRAVVEEHFREHPEPIRQQAQSLVEQLAGAGGKQQMEHLSKLWEDLPAGDPLRGLQLFRSSRAACSACHAVGYHGGRIGPDLTRINRIRSGQELLEAIVYPSASFVRSYESFQVLTFDGRSHVGVIADEDLQALTLVTGIDQRVRILREDIETIQPSAVSIMPAGLDQQLTLQELADLIAFLKSER